jgi:NTE family protein
MNGKRCSLAGDRATPGASSEARKPSVTDFQSIALLLQAGGALGAYQAGVFEALQESGITPNLIAGISIGAINSALIAGNAPEDRVAKLRSFWELVSDESGGGLSSNWSGSFAGDDERSLSAQLTAARTMPRAVPGFFTPRVPAPTSAAPGFGGATSWYSTDDLRRTLERLVDFDRINAKEMRFSVGAVNVRTGNFVYFDDEIHTLGPEHIMASAALPPAFDAVEIEGEFYWDGGMVSNTPPHWVLSTRPKLDTLVFQVDLWSARGPLPRDLAEVALRMKEIQYSSRTRAATADFSLVQRFRAAFHDLLARMPPELAATSQARFLAANSEPAVYSIVQLVYRATSGEGDSKGYNFSHRTMKHHWIAGRRDAMETFKHPGGVVPPKGPSVVKVYDFNTPTPHFSAQTDEED